MDLAKKMQLEFSGNIIAVKNPTSPCSSDSTWEAATQQFMADDDDFADSPVLSNSNAMQRAKQKQKNPLLTRMKLKKAPSDATKRPPKSTGFHIFQAEQRSKVFVNFHCGFIRSCYLAAEIQQCSAHFPRFVQSIRCSGEICCEHGCSFRLLLKIFCMQWRNLSDAEKLVYKQRAEIAKTVAQQSLAES